MVQSKSDQPTVTPTTEFMLLGCIALLSLLTVYAMWRSRRPVVPGSPSLVPWTLIGMFAAAGDVMMIIIATGYFRS